MFIEREIRFVTLISSNFWYKNIPLHFKLLRADRIPIFTWLDFAGVHQVALSVKITKHFVLPFHRKKMILRMELSMKCLKHQ